MMIVISAISITIIAFDGEMNDTKEVNFELPSPEIQPFEVAQPLKMGQPRVGDPRVVEVQIFEVS